MGTPRLFIASALLVLAERTAPRRLRPLFTTYRRMLLGFDEQLRAGRTYGVVVAAWSLGPVDGTKALEIEGYATGAAASARAAIERREASHG